MGKFVSGRLAAGIGVGMAVAAVAGTGVAMAAVNTGVISACYNSSGTLRVATSCRSGETALSWNQTGPQGPAGAQGPAGPAGPAGATKVQVVKQSGAVDTNTEVDLAAVCPSGTTLTGGGGEVSPNGISSAYLTASSPYYGGGTSPIGWHVIGTNTSGSTLTFSAYALCAAP